MFYNEKLYYLLCSCANPIFGEVFGQNALRLQEFLYPLFHLNKSIKWSGFLHIDANSQKLKADWKIDGWTWTKMGVAKVVRGTAKLNVSQKWAEWINWFFARWHKFLPGRYFTVRLNSWLNKILHIFFWLGIKKPAFCASHF